MIQVCEQCKANLPLRQVREQRLFSFCTHDAFRRSLTHEDNSTETLLHPIVAHGSYKQLKSLLSAPFMVEQTSMKRIRKLLLYSTEFGEKNVFYPLAEP